ncbi:nucleotide-diphospho-sugar transferase [Pilaira anomala]|nr:nucleotide-diphospho-sugar transferase [Pilaira anomala]
MKKILIVYSTPNSKLNAAYITFVDSKRETLDKLRYTVRNIEDVFNKNYHYPYIIFSAEELSTEYKELVSSLTKGSVSFQRVSSTEYGYSKSTSFFRAFIARRLQFKNEANTKKIRFKSRLFAGTLYNHQSLEKIDYFWRFEAGTEYTCPIEFDPFQYMQDHDKQISFSIASYGQPETVPTVYRQVTQFKKEYYHLIENGTTDHHNIMVDTSSGDYNYCFFWNNFQIAKTSFFQSEAYQTYFKFMDKQNGIFYESWSDANQFGKKDIVNL